MADRVNQIDGLAQELRLIAPRTADPDRELTVFLESELSSLSAEERLPILESLAERFSSSSPKVTEKKVVPDEASRLMMSFLGRDFVAEGLGQEEIFEKFASSLNTLFDSLNRITAVIQETLTGEQPELATIRKIIGSSIDGEENSVSINEYLQRIQKSFLIAHRSFQDASESLAAEILRELDPENLAKAQPAGLKFGALRKAELFDMLDQKFTMMKRWHASGQYRERLLREFEKRCQREIDLAE